jgi:hypothetical protein
MKGVINQVIPIPKIHAPADNTAAVITLAATAGVHHVVDKVFGGYDDNPAAEKSLTIALTVAGTAVTMTFPVSTDDGFVEPRFDLNFNPPLQGDENKAVTITLPASGDAAIAGRLNAITR